MVAVLARAVINKKNKMTNKPKIILTVAISGAGKSTFCQEYLAKYPSTIYLCPDVMRGVMAGDEGEQNHNYQVFNVLDYACRYFMSLGKDILIDATNYNIKNRKCWLRAAKDYYYEVIGLTFEATLAECLVRNETREKRVPIDVIQRQHDNYQKPELSEGFDKILLADDYLQQITWEMPAWNYGEAISAEDFHAAMKKSTFSKEECQEITKKHLAKMFKNDKIGEGGFGNI